MVPMDSTGSEAAEPLPGADGDRLIKNQFLISRLEQNILCSVADGDQIVTVGQTDRAQGQLAGDNFQADLIRLKDDLSPGGIN